MLAPTSSVISPYLLHENEEMVIETARCLGNFSRDKTVRQLLAETRTDETLVMLLDHSNRYSQPQPAAQLQQGSGVQRVWHPDELNA